jgi:hypothetical protein
MPPRQSPTAQDKPFTFKSNTGHTIVIPSSETYDPDIDAIVELNDAANAVQALNEETATEQEVGTASMRVTIATVGVIKSGFTPETAAKIKLKASEIQTFMTKYQQHTGVSIPK